MFEQLKEHATELLVALGREGKQKIEIDAGKSPRTAAMAAKLQTDQGQGDYRKRKWIAEPPNGWIKNVLGFRQFSMRGLHRVPTAPSTLISLERLQRKIRPRHCASIDLLNLLPRKLLAPALLHAPVDARQFVIAEKA